MKRGFCPRWGQGPCLPFSLLHLVKVQVAQWCPTLCNPMDCTVHGILQARILEPFPSPGDLPNPGIKPRSPALQAYSLPAEPQGKPIQSDWQKTQTGQSELFNVMVRLVNFSWQREKHSFLIRKKWCDKPWISQLALQHCVLSSSRERLWNYKFMLT